MAPQTCLSGSRGAAPRRGQLGEAARPGPWKPVVGLYVAVPPRTPPQKAKVEPVHVHVCTCPQGLASASRTRQS